MNTDTYKVADGGISEYDMELEILADRHRDKGNYRMAMENYNKVLQNTQHDVVKRRVAGELKRVTFSAYKEAAENALENNNFAGAADYFADANSLLSPTLTIDEKITTKMVNDTVTANKEAGEKAFQKKDFATATKYFAEAHRNAPEDKDIANRLRETMVEFYKINAHVALREKRYIDAKEDLEHALKFAPGDSEITDLLANVKKERSAGGGYTKRTKRTKRTNNKRSKKRTNKRSKRRTNNKRSKKRTKRTKRINKRSKRRTKIN